MAVVFLSNSNSKLFSAVALPQEVRWRSGAAGVPQRIFENYVCVRLHPESSEPAMWFSQTTPDEHPTTPPLCRWPALITSPRVSSFGAAAVMLCCSPPPASSSIPLRPSVRYPSIGVVNIMCIRTFCDHLPVLTFSIRLVSF